MVAKKQKKSKTTRRRASRPVRVMHKKDKAVPGGLIAGVAAGVATAVTSSEAGGQYGGRSAVDWYADKSLKPMKKVECMVASAYDNMLTWNAATPLLTGAAVSIIGPKVPIIGKPANRMVRKLTKGKVSL